MLYFDWLSPKHFGSIRQQIWAFLHFPFHLALVLFMEGTAQFIIWQKLVEVIGIVSGSFGEAISEYVASGTQISDLVDGLNVTIQDFMEVYPPTYTQTVIDFEDVLTGIGSATTDDEINSFLDRLVSVLVNSLFTTYGIVAPEDKNAVSVDVVDDTEKQFNVISLVVSSNPLIFLSIVLPFHLHQRSKFLLHIPFVFETNISTHSVHLLLHHCRHYAPPHERA